ncbi:Tubulin-tyrosine ligase family protein [Trichomonas vaginalis G3]|uniref:Tubulin-tyrosine ligase family protein n=1 Tax=Trichomonas vaginalis (strain ATCC PRA-98 / G3) TaxID=412133 RepID=A2FH91_TRIV3|nr:tubulin polyglutamylase TTLl11 family [Trichomonas vaginalis G3]EAX95729.1 Tubulin-tyrosine ligase family protein [Trichomonas vaginalis G3]KAI5549313.1 tubulin polyglutamylase TTLl11 family [Trichomonas vaginalis G3]|eukprot:XP_001308659.1 Tubulin-tyrosine ligase family protein [Trichomonas vaginalis G3]
MNEDLAAESKKTIAPPAVLIHYLLPVEAFSPQILVLETPLGNISKMKNKNSDRSQYLVQTINTDLSQKSNSSLFFKEVQNLSSSKYPTILPFEGFTISNSYNCDKPAIVYDCYTGLKLSEILEIEDDENALENWNLTTKIRSLIGVAFALDHIHGLNIAHGNINAESVVYGGDYWPYLANLSFENFFNEEKVKNLVPSYFETTWKAPELTGTTKKTLPGDIYSFGMLILLLFVGQDEFEDIVESYTEEESELEIPDSVPSQISEIIQSCCNPNPQERPVISTVLQELQDSIESIQGVDVSAIHDFIQQIKGKKSNQNKPQEPKKQETKQENEPAKEESFIPKPKRETPSKLKKIDSKKSIKSIDKEEKPVKKSNSDKDTARSDVKKTLKKKPQKTVFVNVENTCYPSITRNTKKMGWKTTDNEDKTILFWYDNNVSVDLCLSLQPWQFINHIPGTYVISRKVELARNIERIQKYFPKIYTFHPLSFAVPAQSLDLQQYMMNAPLKDRTFIIKPDLGAQGKGIYLIQNPDDVLDITETSIAQQYINSHLIDGYKFDLRIYVLVSSVSPLRIYTFNEGMARFCTEPYKKPRQGNLDQIYRHLTNYSVNKKNSKFEQPTDDDASNDGFKRSFSSVLHEMKSEGVDTDKLLKDMHQLIVLTILAVYSYIKHSVKTAFRVDDGKSRCFEIMGYDILIDKKNKPWLLEVNHSPSLQCDSPFDKTLKDNVISGAMKIMDLNPNFKKIVIEQERIRTQNRITGKGKDENKSLYDEQKEYEISKTTGWMQLYPCLDDAEQQKLYEEVLKVEGSISPIGTDETVASNKRKIAIQEKLKKIEESEKKNLPKKVAKPKKEIKEIGDDKESVSVTVPQPKPLVSKTPRSVQLLREAKLARIRSEQMREQHMKSYDDLPEIPAAPAPHGLQAYARAVPHVTKPKIVPKNIIFDM